MPAVFTGEGWQDFDWHSHPCTKALSGSCLPAEWRLGRDQEMWIPLWVLPSQVCFLLATGYIAHDLKKTTYEMNVMGSILPFDRCGYWPSNPPHTGFCTCTERGLQAQPELIPVIQPSLMSHMETKLSFLTFAHTNANPEAFVHKWILRNQPEEQKESWFLSNQCSHKRA